MSFVFNPLYGTFDIDKGHGDILAPGAASANQIVIFTDPTHVVGATGNGLVQAIGGIYGVVATGAINATAPLTISGVGKAVGGSVNAVITTGNIAVNSSVLALTGGVAASLSNVTLGWVAGTTAQYLRGDATWQNFPAILSSGNLTVTGPVTVTGVTSGVLLGSGADIQVTTGNINATIPLSISGDGKAVGGSVNATVTTATATVNAPIVISGVGNVLSATNISVTTGNVDVVAPVVFSGDGRLVAGSGNISVTTDNINVTAPVVISGVGKAVAGSVNVSVTTGALNVNAPIVFAGDGRLVGGSGNISVTTANLSISYPLAVSGDTTGIIMGTGTTISMSTATTDMFLRGDGVWAVVTANSVAGYPFVAISPLVLTGAGLLLSTSANIDVTTGNITGGTDVIISGVGKVVGGSVNIALNMLSASTENFVGPAGNDVTGDGSSGNPFATITHALSVIPKNLNLYSATIILLDGSYTEDNINIEGFYNGSLDIYSDSFDSTKVLIEGVVDSGYSIIESSYTNSSNTFIGGLSLRVKSDSTSCFYGGGPNILGLFDIRVGDDDTSTNTIGITAVNGKVSLTSIANIDTANVSTGVFVNNGSIVYLQAGVSAGDTSFAYYGIVVDETRGWLKTPEADPTQPYDVVNLQYLVTGNINGSGCSVTGAGKAFGGSVNITVTGLGTATRYNFGSANLLGGSVNLTFATTLNTPYCGQLIVCNSGGQQQGNPDYVYWNSCNVVVGLTSFAISGTWAGVVSIPSA